LSHISFPVLAIESFFKENFALKVDFFKESQGDRIFQEMYLFKNISCRISVVEHQLPNIICRTSIAEHQLQNINCRTSIAVGFSQRFTDNEIHFVYLQ
jgi:hypothetical protein